MSNRRRRTPAVSTRPEVTPRPEVPPRPAGSLARLGAGLARRLPVLLLALLLLVLVRTAWMSDDAYITLRTVDNFVHGHGLRWNVDERVQTYTHPLWLFLISPFYAITREAFYTVIFLSAAISLFTVGLLARRFRGDAGALALGGLMLLLSRAFIDYSTSGLENPLTHLLVVCFLVNLREGKPDRRAFLVLSALAGLAVLNRMDSLLFFTPALLLAWARFGWKRGVPLVAAGFLPFFVWELFGLFYYGLPYPNTALAKLNTGIDSMSLARQGCYYLANSLRSDPVTLTVIAAALAFAAARRRPREMAVALGLVLYLAYVVKIGGDFMSGRFLSFPLVAAVVLVMQMDSLPVPRARVTLAGLVLLAGILTPHPSVVSGAGFGEKTAGTLDRHGIADERRFYFPLAGMWNRSPFHERPDRELTRGGREARRMRSPILVEGRVGILGFYAGPDVHIVDNVAIGDPLLARLPVVERDFQYERSLMGSLGLKQGDPWRIGHFKRNIPAGYLRTILTGVNSVEDPGVRGLYDRLALVTRGPLWSGTRIAEIVRMNLGGGRGGIGRAPRPAMAEVPWDEVVQARPDAAIGYLMRSQVRYGAGELDSSLDDAKRAYSLDPQNADACVQAGKILRDRRDLQGAIEWYRKGLDADPACADPSNALGEAYLKLGDRETGIEYFQRTLRLAPRNAAAMSNIGVTYAMTNRLEEAAVWFRRAWEITPYNSSILENLGRAYLALGDRRKGIEMLEKAIAFEPDRAPLLSAAGIACADEGRDKQARDLLERAVALDPSDAQASYRLGRLLYDAGDRERARELWMKAAELGSEDARRELEARGVER